MRIVNSPHSRRRQQGFTLLEVLVAIVILAVGLMGLGALQLTSLRYNKVAYLRTQATNLAYDLVDRMRANRSDATAGDAYETGFAKSPLTCDTKPSFKGTSAAVDLAEWKNQVACTLPQGNARVIQCLDSNSNNGSNGNYLCADNSNSVFLITIQWLETHGKQQVQQQFSVKTQL